MKYTPEVLYRKLSNILDKSEELKELGLLPIVDESDNSELAPYILLENRLGIPLKYVTTLYKHAWNLFCELKNLDSGYSKETLLRLDSCMKCLLVINPECYSVWNLRKHLIQEEKFVPEKELPFVELLFTFPQHNKSYTSWHHRKWVIELISARTSHTPSVMKEIDICSRVGELYPKNYNAWVHRQWVLKYIDNLEELLEELQRVTCWNNSHISDHSGFHHREQVLLRICQQLGFLKSVGGISRIDLMNKSKLLSLDTSMPNTSSYEQKRLLKLWLSEFHYVKELVTRYPEHETLWYHLRFCYFYWKLMSFEEFNIDYEESGVDRPSLLSEMNFVEHTIQHNSLDSNGVIYALSYKLYILELDRQNTMETMKELSKYSKHTNYYSAHLSALSSDT